MFSLFLGLKHITYAYFRNGSEFAMVFRNCSNTTSPIMRGKMGGKVEVGLLKDDD